ncbi:hypothetical protein CFC21_013721 [Triticum aestivum]|uniref:Uncharacterized protein n=2 Tax=Triticum aestivum TaxID=4565 RepID=A0A9R1IYF7_WHEAT|nr:protein SPEAR3-like [Triticum aestivum]KAF6997506.1 hypothetical protein CFC21_013721 [Triticum aestivum]
MSASNFGDSMEWGRGRSSSSSSGSGSGSRRGKRAAAVDKPRQPQRGLGVAQLEKIRLEAEMAAYQHHPPLVGQPPPSSLIHGTGSFNLQEDARSSLNYSLPSSPSSSFHANNTNVSSTYPFHPNLVMAYNGWRSGEMRYGESPTAPITRSASNYHGATTYGTTHYPHPGSDHTLPLFEPKLDLNQMATVDSSSASTNLDDVDLELKL